jgi:chemotaxis protein MotB
MSYADMITLLFIIVVISIPVTISRHEKTQESRNGEPEHPYLLSNHSGLLSVATAYDEAFRSVSGIIISNQEEENISVGKTDHGIWIDISSPLLFEEGAADIREEQKDMLKSIARSLKINAPPGSAIEVGGYTSDEPLENSKYANNWELSAMRAARIVSFMEEEGVEPERLRGVGYGGNAPLVPNIDGFGKPIAKNRIRNQRVVIRVEVPGVAPIP